MKFFILIFAFAVLRVGLARSKVTSLDCGETSSAKKISITHPKYPPNICEFNILPANSRVCQMRIDFSMTLAQPQFPNSKNGLKVPDCIDDYLLIGNFKLCGVEKSQHVYMPIDRADGSDSVDIVIKITQRIGLSKLPPLSWNLKVTQLECPAGIALIDIEQERRRYKDGYLLAPAGCDQFYPNHEGIIKSFNFNDGKGIYPYNLNYAMCFKRKPSTDALFIYAEDFQLGDELKNGTFESQIDDNCYPQLPANEERVEDYLMIPQAQVQDNEVRANYFCGESLNGLTVLSTNPGPLSIVFNSGSVYRKGSKSLGFLLNYEILRAKADFRVKNK